MRKKNKCLTPYCRNEKAKGKNYCWKCRSRRKKEINPIGYYFNNLRNNARRRGKEFTLTKAEFEQFCKETDYIKLKGKRSTSMTIDRKDHTKGYSYDNIQILQHGVNDQKGIFEKHDIPF